MTTIHGATFKAWRDAAGGLAVVRYSDGASVYFQPGEDVATADAELEANGGDVDALGFMYADALTDHPAKLKPAKYLECCCCGSGTQGRQWHNRDSGYGLCVPCVPFVSRNSTAADVVSSYGYAGVHYAV